MEVHHHGTRLKCDGGVMSLNSGKQKLIAKADLTQNAYQSSIKIQHNYQEVVTIPSTIMNDRKLTGKRGFAVLDFDANSVGEFEIQNHPRSQMGQ